MKNFIIRLLNYFGLKLYAKKLLRMVNFTKKITINHKCFLVPHIYGSSFTISEPWMLSVLERLFEVKSGNFMDIGVNLGQTLLAVKSIDINRKYLGFEPNPACVFYAEELISRNKFRNCKIIPVGLYFEDTILSMDLYADEITSSGGSVIKNFWDYKNYKVKRQLTVPLFTFNTVRKAIDLDNADIIKIDVEGAELEVLQTLNEEIKKNKPIILIEILSSYSIENKLRYDRQNKIEELLTSISYKILKFTENKNATLKGMEKIQSFDVNANPNDCNYLLYHKDNELLIETLFESYILN